MAKYPKMLITWDVSTFVFEDGEGRAAALEKREPSRRERQQDGINKAKARGVRFGPKPILTSEVVQNVKELRADGLTVPEMIRRTKLSKASIYRALAA
jgi:DNA invertase Pin-like site-specific DNA recombinase